MLVIAKASVAKETALTRLIVELERLEAAPGQEPLGIGEVA